MEPPNFSSLGEYGSSTTIKILEEESNGGNEREEVLRDKTSEVMGRIISDCIQLKRALSSELSENSEFQSDLDLEVERGEIYSPTKGISPYQTRDPEDDSHLSLEDFDHPFNGKVIIQDIKIFFLWVFIGCKTSSSEDELIKSKIESIRLSWGQLKENNKDPIKNVDNNIVKACNNFVGIVEANTSSALQQRIVLYTGIALAIIGRMVQLESLQWVAGVVSLIALGTMGWSYTANLLNQSDVKRSLKREIEDYLTRINSRD